MTKKKDRKQIRDFRRHYRVSVREALAEHVELVEVLVHSLLAQVAAGLLRQGPGALGHEGAATGDLPQEAAALEDGQGPAW